MNVSFRSEVVMQMFCEAYMCIEPIYTQTEKQSIANAARQENRCKTFTIACAIVWHKHSYRLDARHAHKTRAILQQRLRIPFAVRGFWRGAATKAI